MDAQDNKLSNWSERLFLVEQDIGLLLLSRKIYATLVNSVPIPNPDTQAENFYFYWWCCGNYAAAAVMGIRRHATGGADSSGLVKLLAELKEEPELLSLEVVRKFQRLFRSHQGTFAVIACVAVLPAERR